MRLNLNDPALVDSLRSFLRKAGFRSVVERPGILAVPQGDLADTAAARRLRIGLHVWVARREGVEIRMVAKEPRGLIARLRALTLGRT